MADKETKLSIVIRTVDKATAKIKAINDKLDEVTKPVRDFKKSLGDLKEKSGLDDVIGGFKGVGHALAGVIAKVGILGGVLGAAAAGMLSIVAAEDELGKKATELGVGVDFLAQLRYAADRTGVDMMQLNVGLSMFSANLGKARAGTGTLVNLLKKASPALLHQLKAAKSNEEAFNLLAAAMGKLHDPAKRAALAQAALGNARLAPLFAQGAKGLAALRKRYTEIAGSQKDAAGTAADVDDAMADLHAALDGVKAALVTGLGPAMKDLIQRMQKFFTANRARIAEWAKDLGKKIPGAVEKLIGAFKAVVGAVAPFVDSSTKLKVIAGVLAAVILGPLVESVYALGEAILTTPVGWILAAIAAIAAGVYEIIKHWKGISAFFVNLWDGVKATFKAAWEYIKGIYDKVVAAAEKLIEKAVWLKNNFTDAFKGPTEEGSNRMIKALHPALYKRLVAEGKIQPVDDVVVQSRAALGGSGQGGAAQTGPGAGVAPQPQHAKVTVDFANVPRGARVRADPLSTADVNLSVGYNMEFAR